MKTTRAKNLDFLRYMEEYKKRIGDGAYYKCLKKFGYEHAYQITDCKLQIAVFQILTTLPMQNK